MINLIAISIKFSKKDSIIKIRLSSSESDDGSNTVMVDISVKDTGIGFSQ